MSDKSFLPSLWSSNEDKNVDVFQTLHKEMNRVFDDFHRGFNFPAFKNDLRFEGSVLSPKVNVTETDNTIEISAELPGVEEKDIDVSLSDQVLTIKAEKKSETEDTSKDYHLVERSYGSFQRSLRLPFDIEADHVKADFKNGVLMVSLPKPPELEKSVKKIKVGQS